MNQSTPSANILVVDDTPANLRLLVEILQQQGYLVRPVTHGKLALSAAQGLPPDLILLDIFMPEMDGYEVCQQLKNNEKTKDIPIIFISAANEIIDKVKAFQVGGVDYITKPFQVEEVLVRVTTHLNLCALQKKLSQKNEELTTIIEQLTQTQTQLIQTEKMAALGNLIAGIAHEINTPMGAIRSSIENIASFFDSQLIKLPKLHDNINSDVQENMAQLIKIYQQQNEYYSTREKRQIRKKLVNKLEEENIDKSDEIADTMVDLGIHTPEQLEDFIPLIQHPDGYRILEETYYLTTLQTSTKTILTATERATKIVYALKSYAHFESQNKAIKSNIIEGIETILTLYHNHLKKGIEVIKNYTEIPLISCYPDQLNQVWTNLINNAIHGMNNQGTLIIDIIQEQQMVKVIMTDNGLGIPLEIQDKIFEPFFTTKAKGEGSGLGLDIVKKIINKHQGTIEFESMLGKTSFIVSLPINLE
ncbi:hybrid sensor histidine kinase/response regulator [Aphanothece hegewaldii CCALA 016]|uniref:histidine kinase n=1 Tax=Aphanothece hegewaldii CCALA 016 TaxID=2107694 RepID=A0A2T1M412_9CHRO|nr:response regulator [Aphanothece hegewaldii]PSF39558.1 hybrid sensor histidine kinase/response regulator [Aphanothece hegewaldii CCALA 016]